MAGEYPAVSFGDPASLDAARLRLRRHLEVDLELFVDLTQAGELPPYDILLAEEAAALDRRGRHVRYAIRDNDAPAAELMVAVLDEIDRGLAESRKVYVHCRAGVGRTGTAVGCWLVRHGATGEEALAAVSRLYHEGMSVDKRIFNSESPECESQRQMVLGWEERP